MYQVTQVTTTETIHNTHLFWRPLVFLFLAFLSTAFFKRFPVHSDAIVAGCVTLLGRQEGLNGSTNGSLVVGFLGLQSLDLSAQSGNLFL